MDLNEIKLSQLFLLFPSTHISKEALCLFWSEEQKRNVTCHMKGTIYVGH